MVVDVAMLSVIQKQALFFRDPLDAPTIPGTFGTLYLLRRDINDMMAAMPNSALWPRAMAVLAGIDLVAKFYANNDANGQVGARFTGFVRDRITHEHVDANGDADTVYQLRNSMLHSFGLFSQTGVRTYRFSLIQGPGDILMVNDPNNAEHWIVNIGVLQRRFEAAISTYRDALSDGNAPFPFSEQLFERYGWINIG